MTATIWSRFYWSDWANDPGLRLCSLAAQGLWMRCLCVAAEGDPAGYLIVKGRVLKVTDIARLAGVNETECEALLSELAGNGVFSRARTGAIYSRRMVRDQKKAAIARKNGEKGGNPSLSNPKENPAAVKAEDKPRLKSQKPESSKPESSKPDKDDEDALGWPMPNTIWVEELIGLTGCADPARDAWPWLTASVIVGWRELDRFEWRDVLAGIRTTLSKARGDDPPRSWRYFAPEIANARRMRTTPTQEPSRHDRARTRHDRNQDGTVAAFHSVFGGLAPGQAEPDQPAEEP